MLFAPTALDLARLFQDPHMFDERRSWQKAGFSVEGEGRESNIMVASHPAAPGYLFKKYSKKITLKEQIKNFHARVEGASKVRIFVAERSLTRIVVPQKYLYKLPSSFERKGKPSYVLIVEKLNLLPASESKQRFKQLDNEGLRQLCAVLCTFRGLDSGVRNVPFTRDGRIAFIDTERWAERREKKIFLRRIREYLSADQRKRAEAIFAAS